MRTRRSSLRHDPVSMSEARRAFAANPFAAFSGDGLRLRTLSRHARDGRIRRRRSPSAWLLVRALAPHTGSFGLARRTFDVRARLRRGRRRGLGSACAARSARRIPGCIVIDEFSGQFLACAGDSRHRRRAVRRVPGGGLGRRVRALPVLRHRRSPARFARCRIFPRAGASCSTTSPAGIAAGGRPRRRGLAGAAARMDLTLAPEEGAVEPNEPLAPRHDLAHRRPGAVPCRVRTESGARPRPRGSAADRRCRSRSSAWDRTSSWPTTGFPGVVLRLEGEFLEVRVDGRLVDAGGGAAARGRLRGGGAGRALRASRPISGIPSSIGGAVRINAGAYGGEIFDVARARPARRPIRRACGTPRGGGSARLPVVGARRDARDRQPRASSR